MPLLGIFYIANVVIKQDMQPSIFSSLIVFSFKEKFVGYRIQGFKSSIRSGMSCSKRQRSDLQVAISILLQTVQEVACGMWQCMIQLETPLHPNMLEVYLHTENTKSKFSTVGHFLPMLEIRLE
jgi:hypothetical protein